LRAGDHRTQTEKERQKSNCVFDHENQHISTRRFSLYTSQPTIAGLLCLQSNY
jgi:hypothetical protein